MDLHAGQIQGFFDIPVDNLFAAPVILKQFKHQFNSNLVIVSPDAGGVERARAFAKRLDAGLVIVDKRRDAPNKAKAMTVIGDVDGKTAVILDDMVDTAGTLTEAAAALTAKGAREVHACCTHAVLWGPAVDRIRNSTIKNLMVTDTIPLKGNAKGFEKATVLSIAELFSEAIIRSHRGDSVTSLFV
jgi:ribose-phosphate pyrophosphokinase